MKHIFKKIFFGDLTVRDYANIRVDSSINEKVFLEIAGNLVDITQIHWPLALHPFIFGVWAKKNGALSGFDKTAAQQMLFKSGSTDIIRPRKGTTARLTLDFFDSIEEQEGTLLLLKIRHAKIYHGHFLKLAFLFFKYYKKPGLSFEQFRSFVAAYSYPRIVRIISFREGGYFNIFPMDLLGEIPGTNKYVFGLRHTNITLSRIIDTKKLVVSECSSENKDAIYELGKHHGGTPPGIDSLPFTLKPTHNYGFYVPSWVDGYREIRVLKTMNLGSHMLLWGESDDIHGLPDPSGHLFHIHFLLYLLQRKTGHDYPLA